MLKLDSFSGIEYGYWVVSNFYLDCLLPYTQYQYPILSTYEKVATDLAIPQFEFDRGR